MATVKGNALTLGSAQTGNTDTTDTWDRGISRDGALLRIVSTVGATPTVTVSIEGSLDGTNFVRVPHRLTSAIGTLVNATFTITTATTTYVWLEPGHAWRYLKVVYSANTNVTVTTVIAR